MTEKFNLGDTSHWNYGLYIYSIEKVKKIHCRTNTRRIEA